MKVYLDTSVIGAYFDEKMPERQRLTKEFWQKLKKFDVFISELTIEELSKIKDEKLRKNVLKLIENFNVLKLSSEARKLGDAYVSHAIIPKQFKADAHHVAVATINEMDFLVSWNFKHLVNVRVKRCINLVNLKLGFKPLEIISPPEL